MKKLKPHIKRRLIDTVCENREIGQRIIERWEQEVQAKTPLERSIYSICDIAFLELQAGGK